ncbi:MAG TPA: Yip1 family protein, partial [Bacteroidota bacterium]
MTLVDRASAASLVDRAKNIIVTPKTEWQVVAGETPNIQQIILGYVLPLALIPAVATILGGLLFRSGIFFSMSYYIATALVAFVANVIGVFVTAFVIDFLAPNFGSEKGLGRAVQLVAYSYTPMWVAGILNIIPGLGIIAALVGLYGIYLMYLGLPLLMKTP